MQQNNDLTRNKFCQHICIWKCSDTLLVVQVFIEPNTKIFYTRRGARNILWKGHRSSGMRISLQGGRLAVYCHRVAPRQDWVTTQKIPWNSIMQHWKHENHFADFICESLPQVNWGNNKTWKIYAEQWNFFSYWTFIVNFNVKLYPTITEYITYLKRYKKPCAK